MKRKSNVIKRRMNLDLTPQAMARLERLQKAMDAASYIEVIRRALESLEEAMNRKKPENNPANPI